jgi:chromosome partitioning protein
MQTLAVISQKGGVGKTTTATCLAVEAARAGQRVLLIDLDPQATATFWADLRADKDVAVLSVQAARLAPTLKAAQEAGTDLVIIDGAAVSRDIAYDAANAADFVLIPFKAAIFDLNAVAQTVEIVKKTGTAFGLLMTFVAPQGREAGEAQEVARQIGAGFVPVTLGLRKAYFRAQAKGLAVQELADDPKAAAEIKDLYAYTRIQLNNVAEGAGDERKHA